MEIPPDNVEDWNELLEQEIMVFWNEVKDMHKLKLIEQRTGEEALNVFQKKTGTGTAMRAILPLWCKHP